MRSCTRIIGFAILYSLLSLTPTPDRASPSIIGAWTGPVQSAWAADSTTHVPDSLIDFLALDRFHYYIQQLSRTIEKRGRPDLGVALREVSPEKIRSILGADPALRDPNQYDLVARKLLKKTHPSLQFIDAEVVWNYPFFKNKLAESFKVIDVPNTTGASSAENATSAPDAELPFVDRKAEARDVTLDVSEYSSWKTTRGVFWDAATNHHTMEFHLGPMSDFLKHVEANGGKIQGEVRALARNYNRIFIVEYPANQGGLRYAVTQISGRDRLQHLMQQSYLTPWDSKGKTPSIPKHAVFGSPVALQIAQQTKFTSVYEALPRADQVIIGQRDGIKKMIRAAAIAQNVVSALAADPAKNALFTAEERKVLSRFESAGDPLFLSYRDGKAWESMAAQLKITVDGASIFETELDLGSHDLTDVLVKDAEGKIRRWRLISNTWGDEIVPISKALAATGHKKITYIGTAGALPESGLSVGALVAPKTVYGTNGKPIKIPSMKNPAAGTKEVQAVAHVKTPFQETVQWLDGVRGHAQVVELETAYLAEIFAKPDVDLDIYLLVSDVVGSEADTLAQSGTDSSRATTRKKLLEHLLQTSLEGRQVVDPRIDSAAIRGMREPFMRWAEEIAPKRDVLSRFQVAREARANSLVTREAVAELIAKEPSFTTGFAEKKLIDAGTTLSRVISRLNEAGIALEASLPAKGLADGSWNPKTEPVVVYLDPAGSQPGNADIILGEVETVYKDTPALRKVIELKVARGPPDGKLVELPNTLTRNPEGLVHAYEKVALELGGLVSRETRNGGLRFSALNRVETVPAWPMTQSLDFFAPDAETAALLKGFANTQNIDSILRAKVVELNRSGTSIHYEQVSSLPDGKLASITPGYDADGTPFVRIQMTDEGARNPMVVLEEFLHLSQIIGDKSAAGSGASSDLGLVLKKTTHFDNWVEIAWNAQAGSESSQFTLASMELDAIQAARKIAKSNAELLRGASPDSIDAFFDRREAHAERLFKTASQRTKSASKKANVEWQAQRSKFASLESANTPKLNELVAKNDRVGVRKLLDAYLPWPLMEPTEQAVWRHWLDAIEHPNPAKLKIVFRGLEKGQLLQNSGAEFMMATVLSKNQGNYNRRLRSLTTMREKVGKTGPYSTPNPEMVVTFAEMFARHAGQPLGTPFISASELEVARRFSGEGTSVLRIDERRLLPNTASLPTEFEILIPLMVFPDEIIGTVRDIKSGYISDEKLGLEVRDLLTKKLGRAPTLNDFVYARQASSIVESAGAQPTEAKDWAISRESVFAGLADEGRRALGQMYLDDTSPPALSACIKRALEAL